MQPKPHNFFRRTLCCAGMTMLIAGFAHGASGVNGADSGRVAPQPGAVYVMTNEVAGLALAR